MVRLAQVARWVCCLHLSPVLCAVMTLYLRRDSRERVVTGELVRASLVRVLVPNFPYAPGWAGGSVSYIG